MFGAGYRLVAALLWIKGLDFNLFTYMMFVQLVYFGTQMGRGVFHFKNYIAQLMGLVGLKNT